MLGYDNISILGWEFEIKGKIEENKMFFWFLVDYFGLF